MAMRHKVVSVTAAVQNLATVLGVSGNSAHCSFFSIQPLAGNAGIVYLGAAADTLTAASAYGFRLEIPVSTVPSAPFFRESKAVSGFLDLAEWTYIGTASDSIAVMWDSYP